MYNWCVTENTNQFIYLVKKKAAYKDCRNQPFTLSLLHPKSYIGCIDICSIKSIVMATAFNRNNIVKSFGVLLISTMLSLPSFSQALQSPLKPTATGYAPVNGLKLYYETYGSGKPLLLIHGGLHEHQYRFWPAHPTLAKTRKVIDVELQEHGRRAEIKK